MIKYIEGDATKPIGDGMKIIVHVNNDVGSWGSGFVVALSAKWSEPEKQYRSLKPEELQLGNVQFVQVEEDIIVANLIGQRNTRWDHGNPPVRYGAIEGGLKTVNQMAKSLGASIHMPRIGCGLAGGTWTATEERINLAIDKDIEITVYDFVDKSNPNYVKPNLK